MADKVLIIGSGGREHAIAWKLAQSNEVKQVFVSPGNAGTSKNFEKVSNVCLDVKDFKAVAKWCKDEQIALVVVGPEDPLANGIADVLNEQGIKCFGPSAKAAEIEASKEFAKEFMNRHDIPTARWKSFTDTEKACDYIKSADYKALVVKASGLAAGKGVVVAKTKDEACEAVKDILKEKKFGAAGNVVVIEELLEGEEVSCLAFSDGTTISCMPPAQDHKRLLDGDEGPNTGGMGAYCLCPLLSASDLELIKKEALQKAVNGMKDEGKPYVGVLYAGLMLTKDGPKVLEYNCRFGDPETQVLLPMLKSDLYEIFKHCVNGNLDVIKPEFYNDKTAVGVVLVSGGYPGSYPKGKVISGLDKPASNELVFHAGTALKDDNVVTSGGRVLAVVAVEKDLITAAELAQNGAKNITFEGSFYRKDIAHKALKSKSPGLTYKDAGVDIDAGNKLIDLIKSSTARTKRSGCVGDLGMFGGIFDLKAAGFKDPLLVSGTDGVGTKLKVAQQCNVHGTVGIDLVAMCVNDVLAHGAESLYFLDYFACSSLNTNTAKTVIDGIAEGCHRAGCALIGGETAEMPGMYQKGEYDLAGFAVGAMEREDYLPLLDKIRAGDVIIGLASTGIHSNGFSLVRKVIEHNGYNYEMKSPFDENKTLGESLLVPTQIYCKDVLPHMKAKKIKAFAHITGGGLPGNVCRVLPKGMGADLDASKWYMLPVFGWLSNKGNISPDEMADTFNCGIGGVLVVEKDDATEIIKTINAGNVKAYNIGCIKELTKTEGEQIVLIKNLKAELHKAFVSIPKHRSNTVLQETDSKKPKLTDTVPKKRNVAVLISGTGTNLQALIDHTQDPTNHSSAKIVLVISNKPDVLGLKRAEKAGIKTKVIKHKDYNSREEFDEAMHEELLENGIEFVCLAGFMRILSGTFVRKWTGKLINIHPSLLPSFKGMNAHKLVLEAGMRISGCSVHFVVEEVDAGAILAQESVPVFPYDTKDTLADRVKTIEHKAYPKALDLLTSGEAVLQNDGKIKWL